MNSEPMQQEGYDFMAAAFEVYNNMENGCTEDIYHESLELELAERKIPYQAQAELTIRYKGKPLKRKFKPDLMVFEDVVVELKAASALTSEHEAQLPQSHGQTCRLSGQLWLPGKTRMETLCAHPQD